METIDIAKELVSSADYLSLSTTDGNFPWTTPLYFANDEDFNFYFVSRKDTQHSQNIYKNKYVSFCIFNSENKDFNAQGLQVSGIAEEVGLSDIIKAMTVIFKKKHPEISDLKKMNLDLKDFTGAINTRMYKIMPTHVFVLDQTNPDMDTRVEVNFR